MDADLLRTLLDYVSDGVCLLDDESRIVYWNRGAEKITGFRAREAAGKTSAEQFGLAESGPRTSVEYIRHRQGHRLPVRMARNTIADATGETIAVAEVFAPASALGRPELTQAARHSGHDPVTGAVNREYGEMRLRQELEVSRRFGLATAWMRVELDDAEKLERSFGRGMVDAAMQMVAYTIDANLNSLDCLTLWDRHSFRVMLRHAVESRVIELSDHLRPLVSDSRLDWWGEARSVGVSISHTMAGPEDTAETLEDRVTQKCLES